MPKSCFKADSIRQTFSHFNCEGTAEDAYQRLSATRSSPETHVYTPSLAERDANINRVSLIVMTGLFMQIR